MGKKITIVSSPIESYNAGAYFAPGEVFEFGNMLHIARFVAQQFPFGIPALHIAEQAIRYGGSIFQISARRGNIMYTIPKITCLHIALN